MSAINHAPKKLPDLIRWVVRAMRPDQLAEHAIARHGFENSDIGLGVMYPDPAGDPQTAHIPPGHVEIYAEWGAPDGYEAIATEDSYLDLLAATLRAEGANEAATKLDVFRARFAPRQSTNENA